MPKYKQASVDKTGKAYCQSCVERGSRGGFANFSATQSQQRNEWLTRHEKHHLPVNER